MTLKGAANTATLITAQAHPTNATLFAPFVSNKETPTIRLKHPIFSNTINLNVDICNNITIFLSAC